MSDYDKEQAVLPKRIVTKELKAKPTKNGRLLQVFLNQDMRNGHEGLAAVAKSAGLDVKALEPGQFVVFVNSAMDRLKMYAAANVVAYQSLAGRKVDMRVIREIPRVFQATGTLDYDQALEKVVQDHFTYKYPRASKLQEQAEAGRAVYGD
jgi:hypothetical protein